MSPFHAKRLLVAFAMLGATACGSGGDGEGGEGNGSATVDDSTCASGTRWAGGNEESNLMHPGGACISCHAQAGEGPHYAIAGTVFADLGEKTDCFGVAAVNVEVTGSDGKTLTLPTNAAGNFASSGPVSFPVQVKVTRGAESRVMLSPVASGDCNGCHTASGEQGAPGRISAP